jgi:hypothetical protein
VDHPKGWLFAVVLFVAGCFFWSNSYPAIGLGMVIAAGVVGFVMFRDFFPNA